MPRAEPADDIWTVGSSPTPAHRRWSGACEALWASDAWGSVLEGLGCTVHYAWNARHGFGVAVPVFRRGPLNAAAFGFPLVAPTHMRHVDVVDADTIARRTGASVIRMVRSQQDQPGDASCTTLPELWAELDAWPGRLERRIAKDLAFAGRATRGMTLREGLVDAAAAWRLYRDTVSRRAARVRYTPEYFTRLAGLCREDRRMAAFSMLDDEGTLRAFVVGARHEDTAYYLHAAVDGAFRGRGLNDLLLDRLFTEARGWGVRSVSLMASPANQPGLVAYKSKWATRRGFNVTCDHGVGFAGRAVEWALDWRRRMRSSR